MRKLLCGIALLFLCALLLAGQEHGAFYDENIDDFLFLQLKNKIPLVVKRNQSDIIALRLVIEGGAPLETPENAGLEDFTLDLMRRGSRKFSYDAVRKIAYEESAELSASSGIDYSVFGFTCIKSSLSTLYNLFEDSFFNPRFDKAEYERLLLEAAQSLAKKQNDPYSVLVRTTMQAIYEGHPYASSSGMTESSLQSITMDAIADCHGRMLDSRRLSFVLVGDLSAKEIKSLQKKLDKSFGKIAAKGYARPEIPPVRLAAETRYAALPTAGDSGYIFGCYSAPSRNADDYIAFALATMVLDNEYFLGVREKDGAVYTVNSTAFGGRQNVGVLSLYKAAQNAGLPQSIRRAQLNFPSGQALAAAVEDHKNVYINSVYSSVCTSGGIAGQIIAGLEYYGDATAYLKRMAQIRAVTANDVAAAFKKYIEQEYLWCVVCAPGAEKKFGL